VDCTHLLEILTLPVSVDLERGIATNSYSSVKPDVNVIA
jgi:hypothetical protein